MESYSSVPPTFSIVVPTRTRTEPLRACLRSLGELAYPREHFEVVVVDDGGVSVEAVIEEHSLEIDVKMVRQSHAGPATARNTGAARAKGQFLLFTDDDCTLSPDYLARLSARTAEAADCLIGGRTVNALPGNLCATASQMLIDYLYAYFNAGGRGPGFFTSNNMVVAARHFRALGGFDTRFARPAAEDRELCDRWIQSGRRALYAPELVVHHAHAMSLGRFCRQHFNYGRGAFLFHRVRAARGHGRVAPEPLAFYVNLLRHPLRKQRGWRSWPLMGLMLVSQLANAAGFFCARAVLCWPGFHRASQVE